MRRRFRDQTCSVAQSLEIIGDWWTLLIIRDAFLGVRRFRDFAERLGISKNILSRRLAHLVDHGVLERVDVGRHGEHYEYALTTKGKDLFTVLTALRQWGDRWVYDGKAPLEVLDRRTGRPLPRVRVLDEQGQPVRAGDLELRLNG
ncbi:MAG: helix-turn-helix transcriptional regulator [Myxococcales bacterium]|nr:helix-turn-helix transcriptional regulator [Myxococcales bacterium]MCB9577011.1 helix-turn-helix transcriptional regulator [Polyangiaceae bacterium]